MKKEIKDYLHLYLGSRCIMEADKFSGGKDYESIVDWSDIGYFHKVKHLILRPLSSMTEEEGEEVGRHGSYGWRKINPPERERPNITLGVLYRQSEEVAYLLSRGFDLFGLIDSGLAVNAETLK